MASRGWLMWVMLTLPVGAEAQTVKAADLVGGWRAELEHGAEDTTATESNGWLVLWPDGLWWWASAFKMSEYKWYFGEHGGSGGARWRLVGDTLWLGNDYEPYFHSMIARRIEAIQQKGIGLSVMDMAVFYQRPPYPIPDSIYWSKAFRDSTTACWGYSGNLCGTWVYKVSKEGQQLHLTRLDSLSRATAEIATKALLTRDSLVNCRWWECD